MSKTKHAKPSFLKTYEIERARVLGVLSRWVIECYGERCPDGTEESCPTCRMWALYDKLVEETS